MRVIVFLKDLNRKKKAGTKNDGKDFKNHHHVFIKRR